MRLVPPGKLQIDLAPALVTFMAGNLTFAAEPSLQQSLLAYLSTDTREFLERALRSAGAHRVCHQ